MNSMTIRNLSLALIAFLSTAFVISANASAKVLKPEELVECPVSENLRGHENTEWSISYAYNLTNKMKDLPRVFLVGDSICNGYQGATCKLLKGKVNVTYWISSYCVTSPGYLKLLAFYLDEAKYDVIHFNNGLHSLSTPVADYAKGIKAALQLIRLKQPQAKIVWVSSTPLKEPVKTAKAVKLNNAALKVVSELGNIEINDLFKTMEPLDRNEYWSDVFHFKQPARDMQAKQVAEKTLSLVKCR